MLRTIRNYTVSGALVGFLGGSIRLAVGDDHHWTAIPVFTIVCAVAGFIAGLLETWRRSRRMRNRISR